MPKESEPFGKLYYKEFYADPAYVSAMSEDCLYLNIWVPDRALQENSSEQHSEKLPVAFWIHGGGFGGGYSSEMEFDGEKYAAKGVILVTVAYRLNVFGFLAHPWLSEENEKKISGNYGIMDQIAALKWVYENISAFGGDPQNITVFVQKVMEECRRWSRKCEETYGQPAWLYHFGHPLPGDEAGVLHSSELWCMFGTLNRCWRPMEERDYEISTEMVDYWTDFMKYGTPDRSGDIWKPYRENDKYIKEFR